MRTHARMHARTHTHTKCSVAKNNNYIKCHFSSIVEHNVFGNNQYSFTKISCTFKVKENKIKFINQ